MIGALAGGGSGASAAAGPRIGREAAEHRDALLQLAADLQAALPSGAAAPLAAAIRALEARTYTIAVCGRTEARLARTAQALSRSPGLLPDLPPAKSATVIALRHGAPDAPPHAASIRHFSADDWAEMAAAAPPAPAGPGDRAGRAFRLARQVEEMRTRAYMRLGPQFRTELGRDRQLAAPDAAVLARHLGSDGPGAAKIPERARYADITREVAFHCPPGPFALPVVVAVTPGEDESFLVRGLRSAACRDAADLCLLVIPADAPLGRADRDLLDAMLAAEGRRLVVFLDRGGAEPAPGAACRVDPQILAAAVARRCRERCPELAVPVVLGSADTALQALALDAPLAGSGLPALSAAIGERLFWCAALDVHARAAAEFEAIAGAAVAELARDIRIIRGAAEDAGDAGPEAVPGVARFDAAERALAAAREAGAARIEAAMSALWARLRTETAACLRKQAEALVTGAAEGAAPGLPARLGTALTALAGGLRDDLAALLAGIRAEMAAALSRAGVRRPLAEVPEGLGPLDLAEALAALEEVPADTARPQPAGPRAEEEMRRLMGPVLPALETAVEATTLALGSAARQALEAFDMAGRTRLARHRAALSRAGALAELEAARAAGAEVAARIAAYRAASQAAGPVPAMASRARSPAG
ncbi:hypothetical protein LNKW23_29440 [Paralimibaculum aggregatum]|uniref:Uncharacterized protein n=1 Tax=Paralimibaculum aggregatum TaxID=3036245 RepID=A0ABQ6LKF5_9RHOB|nr:hypothetical protein [Limibaculum sp. NKW23]GMG83731.1 hypothetical protein LNKW23_29440 [Limibaculum sp. NKW23]